MLNTEKSIILGDRLELIMGFISGHNPLTFTAIFKTPYIGKIIIY